MIVFTPYFCELITKELQTNQVTSRTIILLTFLTVSNLRIVILLGQNNRSLLPICLICMRWRIRRLDEIRLIVNSDMRYWCVEETTKKKNLNCNGRGVAKFVGNVSGWKLIVLYTISHVLLRDLKMNNIVQELSWYFGHYNSIQVLFLA